MEQVKLNQKAADKEKGIYIQEQNIQINQGKIPMAKECHTSTAHNEDLVRPPIHTHKPTTCDEALIRPLQGCNNPSTYKEALVRPPPVNMSQQLETDNCLCERCGHIMARAFAMAANKTDQATQQNQSRNQFEPHNRRFEQNRIEFQEVGLFIILMDLKDHIGDNNTIQGTTINNLKIQGGTGHSSLQ